MWMKRLSFTVCVLCPCERICEPHKKEGCTEETCLHFLNLDECLANKVFCLIGIFHSKIVPKMISRSYEMVLDFCFFVGRENYYILCFFFSSRNKRIIQELIEYFTYLGILWVTLYFVDCLL